MTTQKVYVDIMQTYDFNTEVGKVGVIGFHTPNATTLDAVADGLMKNYKKVYFQSMDFALGCISQLPVDPLGVGFEAGQIAPQDVVNPILFKACTGESLNNILNVIYNVPTGTGQNGVNNTISKFDIDDATQAYYRMMNDSSFRTSHPQRGMVVNGLVPLVRQVLVNRPITHNNGVMPNYSEFRSAADWPAGFASGLGSDDIVDGVVPTPSQFMNGPLVHFPAQDTYAIPQCTTGTSNVRADIGLAYCGCLVLPPAIQNSLYFRMNVVWHVCFEGYRPSYDVENWITNDNSYSDWFVRPVDAATANVMETMTESVDVLDSIGLEEVKNVSTSVN